MNSQLHRIGTKLFSNDSLTIEISPARELDLSNVCRTCLQETTGRNELHSEAVFIIRSDDKLPRLCEMFEASTGLELGTNDKLPSHICDACLQSLKNSYSFRRQSQRAHQILSSVVSMNRNEDSGDHVPQPISLKTELEGGVEVADVEDDDDENDKNSENEQEAAKPLSEAEDEILNSGPEESVTMTYEEIPTYDDKQSSSQKENEEVFSLMEIETLEDTMEQQDDAEAAESDADSGKSLFARKSMDKKTVFICKYCEIVFGLQSELLKHYRLDHPEEKPFKCQVCSMAFPHIQSMRRHKKIHEKLSKDKPCPLCSRCFARRDDLTRHIRTHTDERPYACTMCEKAFKQHTELSDHMSSHDDRKIYMCELCDKKLRSRNGWYMHMRAHERERLKLLT